MKKDLKVLFIIKKRVYCGVSYGLINSCQFISRSLAEEGIPSKIVEVVDGNDIDREVFNYEPSHVFLEAIWVTPEKIYELINIKRYKKIKWYVRLHSNIPFLAHEGVAFDWIKKYDDIAKSNKNFRISSNSSTLVTEFDKALDIEAVYSPNIYNPADYGDIPKKKDNKYIDIGCFGALRFFKNHLEQAIGALLFAKKHNKTIRFHINISKFETQGGAILKNLRALFDGTKHILVEHEWMNHQDFVTLLVNQIDIGLQVSFSETFNIVSADCAANDIPVVGSPEITWLADSYQANPTSSDSISNRLSFAYYGAKLGIHFVNKLGLRKHNKKALNAWLELLS